MDKNRQLPKDADIHLVIPPPFFIKMPHIGIAYLAAFLKSKGYKVSVSDLSLRLHNNAPDDFKRFWHIDFSNFFFLSEIAEKTLRSFEKEFNDFVEELLETDTQIIGFSVNLISIYVANYMARKIEEKDPGRLVIFGGPATFFGFGRNSIHPPFADIYAIGEGEKTLLNILKAHQEKKEISSTRGLLLVRDLERYPALPPPNIGNLDELPFPTFSEFELSEYNQGQEYKPLPLLLSRGCINSCSYCIDHIMWPKYRCRSPGHVMDEIRYHTSENKVTAFEMIDLTCSGNLRWLSELCDRIIESGIKFNWVSYAMIRKEMDLKLLQKMKRAGCHTLIYGVESGSDRVLKKMKKRFTASDAARNLRLTHESGICTNINIIVGFPGETEEDFDLTVDFIRKNGQYIDEFTSISACTLFPESEMGTDMKKYGINLEGDADPMLFSDTNGLNREDRAERVKQLIEIINDLGLKKAIINRPSMNPVVKEILARQKDAAA
ncbi:MAG: radical SAM protein [Candidatus Omnitrophica bacterium]|nr:radical SAM protein [Candidatus Omnitrophota bacterium]